MCVRKIPTCKRTDQRANMISMQVFVTMELIIKRSEAYLTIECGYKVHIHSGVYRGGLQYA